MTTRGGPMGDGYHHRSNLKKPNKPFKGHSKGKLDRQNRGKVDTKPSPSTLSTPSHSKLVRINRSKQLQQQKRSELIHQKRIGSNRGPPRVVALIPLNSSIDVSEVVRKIVEGVDRHEVGLGGRVHELEWSAAGKAKHVILYDTPRDQHAILDIAKVADIIAFIVSPPPLTPSPSLPSPSTPSPDSTLSSDSSPHLFIDDFGRHALTILKCQGLPSTLALLSPPPPHLTTKAVALYKKTAARFFDTGIGEECRVIGMEGEGVRRWLVEGGLKGVGWREERSYMLGMSVQYEEERRVMRVKGWLRGARGLNVNGLIHLTGHGDYQIERIEGVKDRRRDDKSRSRRGSTVDGMEVEETKDDMGLITLATSTDELRESLTSLNPIDPLAHEQSIITDEELAAAEGEGMEDEEEGEEGYGESVEKPKEKRRHVPGETDHQKAWDEALGWEDEEGVAAPTGSVDEEKEGVKEKEKLERDEVDFPDEVSYPPDTVCRERFARYRGLKSFKDSEWDVKEGLPLPYSQIFTFADYKQSRGVARREGEGKKEEEGWVGGERMTPMVVSVMDVDGDMVRRVQEGGPLVLFGLLHHEHKVSVSHCAMTRQAEYSAPIRGKELMEVHCAFRRFITSPIYSSHPSPFKPRTLVERFFHPHRYTTVSFYSHILYPPAPVLIFRPSTTPSSLNPIVATGSLLPPNPDHLLLKRVILTGSPLTCHGREATVHHMFHSPHDIDWFKPVELWTKRGLHGHIKESHGLQGRMECEFDGFIQQNDVVCMSLYKRQFPKFEADRFGTH